MKKKKMSYKKGGKITPREKNFAKMVAMGSDPTQAYLNCYETNNYDYAHSSALALLRRKRVTTMVEKEVELLLEQLLLIQKIYQLTH